MGVNRVRDLVRNRDRGHSQDASINHNALFDQKDNLLNKIQNKEETIDQVKKEVIPDDDMSDHSYIDKL